MWNKSRKYPAVRRQLALALLCAAHFGIAALAQSRPDLPSGPGADVVRAKCVTCHQADLIGQQWLKRAGWQRELDKMIRWGAAATEKEQGEILDYLAANFGSGTVEVPQSVEIERGWEVFKLRCLVCHQTDIIEQQRLGRAAWAREVEKMMRWGAIVADGDKSPLVEYLAERYGPQLSR